MLSKKYKLYHDSRLLIKDLWRIYNKYSSALIFYSLFYQEKSE